MSQDLNVLCPMNPFTPGTLSNWHFNSTVHNRRKALYFLVYYMQMHYLINYIGMVASIYYYAITMINHI